MADKLESHYRGRIPASLILTPSLTLRPCGQKEHRFTPKVYAKHFEILKDGLVVGYLNSNHALEHDLIRIKIINKVFSYPADYKIINEELKECQFLSYQNTTVFEISLNTEEDLIKKFKRYFPKFQKGTLKLLHSNKHNKPYFKDASTPGVIYFKIDGLLTIYEKIEEIQTKSKHKTYQIEYFNANKMMGKVYRLEFKLNHDKIKALGIELEVYRLHEQEYLTHLFNILVEKHMTIVSTENKNINRAKFRRRFLKIVPVTNEVVMKPYQPDITKNTHHIYFLNQCAQMYKYFPELNDIPKLMKNFKEINNINK